MITYFLFVLIIETILCCSPCPEHQSTEVKNDICRQNNDGTYTTNVFEATVIDIKDQIVNPDELKEIVGSFDVIYDVNVTSIYKGLTSSSGLVQLKNLENCRPVSLQIDESYLLAANEDMEFGKCNIVKLISDITEEDINWLTGKSLCQN